MAAAVVCILLAFLGVASAENIARGGQVTQSSIYETATAERAIDGNRNSMWAQGSCTHTQKDNRPWWRLDLLKRYKIYTVTITNRGDAASERLDGAEIHIGDSLEDNGNSNPRCAVISSIAAGATETFNCGGMTGQYVNIVIPNRHEYLTLCEVEVAGDPAGYTCRSENIARGGQVTQSSIYETATAERAIDGNHNSVWAQGSCTHTQKDNRPWWRLDLLKRYKIYTVSITNRGDAASERLDGAEIHIGDSLEDDGNSNPRCAVISSIAAGATETFNCGGMTGQYVNIVIPNRHEYLTLCEVEVAGDPAGYTCRSENIARGGQVTQSSIYESATAERAIDGNHNSVWAQGSCTHTQKDNRPWWRLDLLKRYKIYTVSITNRGDAASERLDGAEIHIGDSLEDDGNSNPRCSVISSIAAGATETFNCGGMTGQYVNIVIPNRHEYLTLCEVEVTGDPAGYTCRSGPSFQTNIARGGQVTQSSAFDVGVPEKAIDGNRDSVWSHRSCTHTLQDNRPWWRLDLRKGYKIYTVSITNRGDAVSERLDGAEIHIGDSLEDNGNSNPRCAVISSIAAGASETFNCGGMTGQFVNIVIPNRHEYLTLCEVEVTGDPAGYICQSGPSFQTNIARGGQVTQSSVFDVGVPERAIDGNRDSVWSHRSCTHTLQDNRPWWRLDLLKRYKIYTVTITNRGDAVSERLDGAEIHIGDSLEDNGNSNPSCAVISSIAAGATETFNCEGMMGQYVNIVIPNRHEYLTLCEVEVTGDPTDFCPNTNIARGGQVTQSSIYESATAERAIDGNRNSMWAQGSCTHTQKDNRPWWRLDLLKRYKIYTVSITNRGDAASERLDGAEIHIGDSLEDNGNSNPRCAVISSIAAGASEIFNCGGMTGQYVNIVIPNRHEYLTLCEVEVTGDPAGYTCRSENIARGGQVTQSSIYETATAERAIDGNHNSVWAQGSCTHTQKDNRPWWRLDLLKRYKIYTVSITNRGDAASERLDGAEIHIGDSLEDDGNSNPRCAVISRIAAGASEIFNCGGMTGQYVNIVIPNRHEYLTLCEVEVAGDPAGYTCRSENIARGGQVTQSSIYESATAERAIDGNHNSVWAQGSCTHTQKDNRPWWRLDLLKRYKIYTVSITNRGDAASERLDGAEIHIGDSLEDDGNSNPRCAVIKSIPPGASETFECNGMKGQYINIAIPDRPEYLTLCEVEVTGIEYNEGSEVDVGSQV